VHGKILPVQRVAALFLFLINEAAIFAVWVNSKNIV